ncbi:hypothetical protein SE17_01275 [Kouleothrix aurantiaca]|uniref:Uncharacterized protein n=1 Tax=Kouleothrix aurantiaca TaxID=186479 RepID=A0A0P9DH66_9CHLR|nr:hypothetical protein SE17_01275 [Kouleothrix aurantiaca]
MLGIVGMIVLPFGLFIGAFGLLHRKKRAIVSKDGFFYTDGNLAVNWSWEEIDAVTFTSVSTRTSKTNRYVVQHQNGQQMSIDDQLHEYSELGALVQEYVAHYRTPSIAARFHNAQVISFGDYAVDQETLWHNEHRLLWSEVDHVRLKFGQLYVYRRGQKVPWDIIPVFHLPNMRIFLRIVQGVVGVQEAPPQQSASKEL